MNLLELIFVFVIWGSTIFFVVVMGFLIFASRQGTVFTSSKSRGPGSREGIWSVANLILSLAELVGGGGGGRGGSSDGGGFSGGGGDSGGGGASGSW